LRGKKWEKEMVISAVGVTTCSSVTSSFISSKHLALEQQGGRLAINNAAHASTGIHPFSYIFVTHINPGIASIKEGDVLSRFLFESLSSS